MYVYALKVHMTRGLLMHLRSAKMCYQAGPVTRGWNEHMLDSLPTGKHSRGPLPRTLHRTLHTVQLRRPYEHNSVRIC